MWSTGERNGKPRQYSCLENPMNSVKRHTQEFDKNVVSEKKKNVVSVGLLWALGISFLWTYQQDSDV